MLLSIITPYYDCLEYTKELVNVLLPQLSDEVEWIIVDDGSNEEYFDSLGINVIHLDKNSGNASIPRNKGLDVAKGEFIAFIDSDDLVSDNYVEIVLKKIKESYFDYCFISWKTDDSEYVIEDYPEEWNTCVWNCIYSKDLIRDIRFDSKRNIGEDKEFNKLVRNGIKENITDVIYYYNWKRPNSLSTQYREGKIPFTRG